MAFPCVSKPMKNIFTEVTVQPILRASWARAVPYARAQPVTGRGGCIAVMGLVPSGLSPRPGAASLRCKTN